MKIKNISVIGIYCLMLAGACNPVFAQSSIVGNLIYDLRKAAISTLSTYRASGISGLRMQSTDCYLKRSFDQFPCVYIDIASRYIDQGMVATNNYPPDEYFDGDKYYSRIGPVFLKDKLNRETSNELMAFMTFVIAQEITSKVLKNNPS